jgi:serine/threonine protein kinase
LVLDNPGDEDTVGQTEGTYHFFAPEACDPELDSYRGKPCDVWALGVTLFSLIFNRVPYLGDTEYNIMQAIKDTPVDILKDCPRPVSQELMDVMWRMMDKNPATRITLEELL